MEATRSSSQCTVLGLPGAAEVPGEVAEACSSLGHDVNASLSRRFPGTDALLVVLVRSTEQRRNSE